MSIRQHQFVMMGIPMDESMFGGADAFYDVLDKYERPDAEVYMLYDSMNGEYLVVGEVLCDGYDYDGMDYTAIEFERLANMKQRVEDAVNRLFGYADQEAKLICVTKWS